MTLISHVPEKNKAVILLSTMHNSAKIDEETKKSETPTHITIQLKVE